MELRKKALGLVSASALLLSLSVGSAFVQAADDTTGGFEVNPLTCAGNTVGVQITSGALDFPSQNVGPGDGVLGSVAPLEVEVTEDCGHAVPWQVDISATDFTLGSGLGALDISSDNLSFSPNAAGVDYTADASSKNIYQVLSLAGICTVPTFANFESHLQPVQSGTTINAADAGVSPILIASSPLTCTGPIPSPVGAPGVTTASWDASLDLDGEFVGYDPLSATSEYTSVLTVSVGPVVVVP